MPSEVLGYALSRSASNSDFLDSKLSDAKTSLHKELEKLIRTATPEKQTSWRNQFDSFENLFESYLSTDSQVQWDKIKPLPAGSVKCYSELTNVTDIERIREALGKLVVIKLNGGLGTSMGCTGPKSLISVRDQSNFLDLNVQQIQALNKMYGSDVPLVLMCSFNTIEDTEKVIQRYSQSNIKIHVFLQSTYPRINRETLLPVASSTELDDAWYPPGHGDVYYSLHESGYLQKLLDEGKEYMFLSNIDNLGASVDTNILSFLVNSSVTAPEFIMEVTDKTRADVKGGTLVEYEGSVRLLEIAQVPKDHVEDFKSVNKFRIFNTNNLWMKLSAIKRVVEDRTLQMEIIINPKTMDNGLNVIQLERACGAAIQSFEGAIGINVPRRRFLPVKMTQDLLTVMSNLYSLNKGNLIMNPARSFPSAPLVKLGEQFKTVKEFLSRFDNIPNLLELDHLTVSGDVTFGKDVTLKGTVIIIANHGTRIDIPPGSILENKIVSGNLRILDH